MRPAHPRLSPCSCQTSLGSVGAVRAVVLAGLAATTHPRPQATKHPPPLWPLLGLPLRLWLRCPGLLFEETAAASCKVWLPWTACRAKCACPGVGPPPPFFSHNVLSLPLLHASLLRPPIGFVGFRRRSVHQPRRTHRRASGRAPAPHWARRRGPPPLRPVCVLLCDPGTGVNSRWCAWRCNPGICWGPCGPWRAPVWEWREAAPPGETQGSTCHCLLCL